MWNNYSSWLIVYFDLIGRQIVTTRLWEIPQTRIGAANVVSKYVDKHLHMYCRQKKHRNARIATYSYKDPLTSYVYEVGLSPANFPLHMRTG